MFRDDAPLVEARDHLYDLILEGGTECPCCGQFAKVYKRKVNSSMARGLIAAYREYGLDFGYLQDVRRKQGETDNREESKLRYWGLMEEEPTLRPDGGRAGWWRVLVKGEDWIFGRITIPKYALLYDGHLLGHQGEPITIQDALGDRFDYRELMTT